MIRGPLLDDAPVTAEDFFRRAAVRLARAPGGSPRGDHDLNPDLARPADFSFIEAAVLVPVIDRPVPTVLLTVRTETLARHAGQVAFPGGRLEPGESAVDGAIREAGEEVGIAARDIGVIGCLDPWLTITGYRVTPVLARIAPTSTIVASPDEVTETFEVPLNRLMTQENHLLVEREIGGVRRSWYEIPYGRYHIWGATAGMIRALHQRVYG